MPHGVAPYPLYWPLQYPRTSARGAARFQVDFASARAELLGELRRLGATDIVLSTNVPLRRDSLPVAVDREPDDPGVAVYFRRKGRDLALACDKFSKVRWNLRAVGATIEALRSIERHGTTELLDQAFSGFARLPPAPSWREILGIPPGPVTADEIRARVRELARSVHPDVGGDPAQMAEINAACAEALSELSR